MGSNLLHNWFQIDQNSDRFSHEKYQNTPEKIILKKNIFFHLIRYVKQKSISLSPFQVWKEDRHHHRCRASDVPARHFLSLPGPCQSTCLLSLKYYVKVCLHFWKVSLFIPESETSKSEYFAALYAGVMLFILGFTPARKFW